MSFFSNALEALPSIASSPLAFVGYALTVGAWVFTYSRSNNLKILMKQIVSIPESDRKSTVIAAIGDVLPDNITAEQWIRSKRQQYLLLAFAITLIFIAIMASIVIFRATEASAAQEQTRAKIAICEAQIRNEKDQWNRGKENLEKRISEVDKSIDYWSLEIRRGMMGVAFAPNDQKEMAMQIVVDADRKVKEFSNEKKNIQEKIDVLLASPPKLVKCDG